VNADVVLNGEKVAGAAQRRTRRGLLQQGSIQNVDLAPEFEKNLAAQLSQHRIEQTIEQAAVERAEQIAKEKYATAAWLRRR
jgi:lipoate-protein ligase A